MLVLAFAILTFMAFGLNDLEWTFKDTHKALFLCALKLTNVKMSQLQYSQCD